MRAHNFKDLTGIRFGMLTAKRFVGQERGKSRWECICDCGSVTIKASQHLQLGLIRSCGCLRRAVAAENIRKVSTKHGNSKHPLWPVWAGMMDRCYNTKTARRHRYIERGIDVAPRWHDFLVFVADMGERPPDHSLDRIDNDGPYSPENCRWATCFEQNNNRCTTKHITFGGETLSGAQWARKLGIGKATLYERLKTMPLERALRRS